MEQTIKITENVTKVQLREKTLFFPDEEKYFIKRKDDFKEAVFALIPKHKAGSVASYTIVKVEHNSQLYTDFIPHDDCHSEFWFKDGVSALRREFLGLIEAHFGKPEEISKDEFFKRRQALLDKWIIED